MKRRDFLQAAGVGFVASTAAAPAMAQSQVTFLVAHGAWSAGWAWKKMHPLMSAAGHRLITPTYTGLATGSIWQAHRTISRRTSRMCWPSSNMKTCAMSC